MTDGHGNGRIKRLCRPTATRLRSSLVIPSLPQVLAELAHNALDAGASSVECRVNLIAGEESVRVEDNGHGIRSGEMGIVGERYRSSKSTDGWSGDHAYGFRGEALASIASLALVEIRSRVAEGETYSKIMRNGDTLYFGPARQDLGRARGTTVTVKDLFNSIPVRRASLTSAPSTSLAACKAEIEALALVAPRVRWTLWEERLGGMRKVLYWGGGRNSLEAFRGLYGHATVERVQSVRVSSGARRADGFVSLDGAFNKAHQHLYVNGYSVANSDLHKAITRRFAGSQFSTMSSNLTDDTDLRPTKKQPSPRRLERFPVYVLNITLPSDEVDAAYDAKKTTIGYKEPERTRAFVIAVVDEFLRKNGFGPVRSTTASPIRSPTNRLTPGPSPLGPVAIVTTLDAGNTPRRLFLENYRHQSAPPRVPDELTASNGAQREEITPENEQESLPTPQTEPISVQDLIKHTAGQVISRTRKFEESDDDEPQTSRVTSWLQPPPSDLKFTHQSIATSSVLRQVDRKFVPCVLKAADTSGTPRKALVVIDQHAADERVGVERILDPLNEGFAHNNMPTTELKDNAVRVVLTRQEIVTLESPGVRDILRRWGIGLGGTAPSYGEYTQVEVQCVPALLDRLGRKNPTELTRLLRLYLPILAVHLPELQVLTSSLDRGERDGQHGWASVQRWMPAEMGELANSKACRGAIMFEDRLDADQCARLLTQLAQTRNPWICPHGRPTLAPLILIPEVELRARRPIDWGAWKRKQG